MKINFKNISILDLAALINNKFVEHNMKTILVGGACVVIYSNNQYQSYDLDFVTYESKINIKKALGGLGFELKGKYFVHPDCTYFVEFVPPPVAVGHEIIHKFDSLLTSYGKVELLSPTDCIKDRLASFFHWKDRQAFEQALMVFKDQKVNLRDIEIWAKEENHLAGFLEFKKALEKINKS